MIFFRLYSRGRAPRRACTSSSLSLRAQLRTENATSWCRWFSSDHYDDCVGCYSQVYEWFPFFSPSSASFNLYLRHAFHLPRFRLRFALPPAIDESYWRWCGGMARCRRCHAVTPDWQLKDSSAAVALLCTAIDFVQWYHRWNFIGWCDQNFVMPKKAFDVAGLEELRIWMLTLYLDIISCKLYWLCFYRLVHSDLVYCCICDTKCIVLKWGW